MRRVMAGIGSALGIALAVASVGAIGATEVGGISYRKDCITSQGKVEKSWTFTWFAPLPFLFRPGGEGCEVHTGLRVALNAIGIVPYAEVSVASAARKAADDPALDDNSRYYAELRNLQDYNAAHPKDVSGGIRQLRTTDSYNSLSERTSMVTPRGNVRGATPAQFTTTYTYDAATHPLSVTDPLGHKTAWTYDANGNVASVADARGNATAYTYDANNRNTKTTRPDGTTLRQAYDPKGTMVSQTDGAGNSTTYTLDSGDHPSSVTDPLGRTTTFEYGSVGQLQHATDPLGHFASYDYDTNDQLSSIYYWGGSSTSVSYGYDATGRRTSMSDQTGSTSYTIDSLGRLTNVTSGSGKSTTFGYDLANNPTSITYPNGKTVNRTFDAVGRMATLTDWLGKKTSFAYSPDSALTTTTFPQNVDSYTYNTADQLTGISMAAGSTGLASIAYTRDANGQVASETPTGLPAGTQSYSYNQLNQLAQASTTTYSYDPADNLTALPGTSGLTYDAANQLTQTATGTSYTYDSLGERTASTPPTGTASSYTYDAAQHLVATTGAASTTYAYDGDGLRTAKTTAGTTTEYTWDQSVATPLLLSDGSTSFIYGPNGQPIEHITSGGTALYYHHDQLGSTRLLTTAAGASAATFSYDPYGKPSGSTGTATTPLGYTGQYTDSETGLVYLRARYYDPATGQFISRDPLAAATRAPYAYAGGNPLNASDPTGLDLVSALASGISSVVPSWASDAAADTLDVLTGGAASDIACNGLHWGNAASGVANLGMMFVPGGQEVVAAERLAAKAVEHEVPIGPVAEKAWQTADRVAEKGAPFPGYKGGRVFENRGPGMRLPESGANGPIKYQEWDVNPYAKGVNRGGERLVTGSDGSAYYTTNHYDTFTRFR
ncbi:MAG TPA: RHS repeat-associated core domain-containing protein [Baekduia sp.]|nr:RHS repeat-associated core domain-containing protein [Baekduia sp.]